MNLRLRIHIYIHINIGKITKSKDNDILRPLKGLINNTHNFKELSNKYRNGQQHGNVQSVLYKPKIIMQILQNHNTIYITYIYKILHQNTKKTQCQITFVLPSVDLPIEFHLPLDLPIEQDDSTAHTTSTSEEKHQSTSLKIRGTYSMYCTS